MTKKTQKLPNSELLLELILDTLEDNKATDIVKIDIRGKSSVADFMVICSGTSGRQISSLSAKIEKEVKEKYPQYICKSEGKAQGDWVLLDVNDVIIHIFRPEVRSFYQLEKIWQTPDEKIEKVIVSS